MELYIGTILPWAGTYAPKGWMYCNGQQMPLNTNQALYAVIGIQYGGDGRTFFNLPNLNGRVPVGTYMDGQMDEGITSYKSGNKGGIENTTLSISNLPSHNHAFNSESASLTEAKANVAIPANNNDSSANIPDNMSYLGKSISARDVTIYSKSAANTTLKPFEAPVSGNITVKGSIGQTGGNTPFDNRQPYLAVQYIICVEGLFPPRAE
jgi:microcystin-dependent protein